MIGYGIVTCVHLQAILLDTQILPLFTQFVSGCLLAVDITVMISMLVLPDNISCGCRLKLAVTVNNTK